MPVYGVKNLNDRLLKLRSDLYTKLPKRIGQDAENHFRDSFKKGGFTDHALVKWKPRAKPPRTKSGKITELAVRDVVHGRAVKNTEALANPEALELFRNLPQLAT